METVHNIQLHGAFKGSSREGRQQPWQSQTVELLWEEQECLKTRAKVQFEYPALSKILYQNFTYLREQSIFSREVDIRPTFVFFPLSRSFGRLLENK